MVTVFVVMIMIMVIVIIVHPLQFFFLGILSHVSEAIPQLIEITLSATIWAVPRMADNCAFPKIFGRLNLPYQAFAFPEIVPSEPMMMGFIVTLVALWFLLISWARS